MATPGRRFFDRYNHRLVRGRLCQISRQRVAGLATPQELSDYLGVPVATLTAWRYRRTGPRFVRVGKHVRYDWRDIERWQTENTQEAVA